MQERNKHNNNYNIVSPRELGTDKKFEIKFKLKFWKIRKLWKKLKRL